MLPTPVVGIHAYICTACLLDRMILGDREKIEDGNRWRGREKERDR